MSNYSQIYWLTRLDYAQYLFITCSVLLGLFILAHLINHLVVLSGECDDIVMLKSTFKRSIVILSFSLSVIAACLIPTKNDMIIILAGGKTLDYVQGDTSLSKLPYQTTKIISDFLDKSIKELKDK